MNQSTKNYYTPLISTIVTITKYNHGIQYTLNKQIKCCFYTTNKKNRINLNPNKYKNKYSYQLLASQAIAGLTDLQKIAKIILESTGLDPEQYRLGHSKA